MPNYPAQIDTSQSLPTAIDNLTPVQGAIFNSLRNAVIAIESELGIKPSGPYATARARLDAIEGTVGNLPIIALTQDLGGTLNSPLVVGWQGRPISSVSPGIGQVMAWNGIAWTPMTTTGGGAVIVISGDLAGNTTNQIVIGIRGIPVSTTAPTTGQALIFNGTTWAPSFPTLGGAAGGDLGGNYPNPSVLNIHGASVPVAGSLVIGNVLQVSGTSALNYAPVNLAGGVNFVTGILPPANLPSATNSTLGIIRLTNDLGGSASSPSVLAINGVTVTGAPTAGKTIVATSPTAASWQTPSSSGGWVTGVDIDFTAQGSQTFGSDTTFSFAGFTWTKSNSANEAASASNINGTGLNFQPAAGTDYNGTRTLPTMWLPLSQILPASFDWSTRLRIFISVGADNVSTSFDNEVFGIDTNSTALGFIFKRGFGTGGQGFAYFVENSGSNITGGFINDLVTMAAGNKTICIEYNGLDVAEAKERSTASIGAGAVFPSLNTFTPGMTTAVTTGGSVISNDRTSGITAATSLGVFLGAQRAGSGTALSVNFQRLRVDYQL